MKVVLFSSRHSAVEIDNLPAIFEKVDPLDFNELDRIAHDFVSGHCDEPLEVYVTGLTTATVAVIKAAVDYQIDLTLFHYDRDSGTYVPQPVLTTVLREQDWGSYGVIVPVSVS